MPMVSVCGEEGGDQMCILLEAREKDIILPETALAPLQLGIGKRKQTHCLVPTEENEMQDKENKMFQIAPCMGHRKTTLVTVALTLMCPCTHFPSVRVSKLGCSLQL